MSLPVCQEWARFCEGDVEFDAVCDNVIVHDTPADTEPPTVHHDPDLGYWDHKTGLHDRGLTPTETRLKR